jgi:hypothetical protein
LFDLPEGVKPAAARHTKVANNNIPLLLDSFFNEVFSITCFRYFSRREFFKNNLLKAFANNGMVICDQYFNHILLLF